MDLNEDEGSGARAVDLAVHRLDQRTLPGAARAPQEDVVGGKAGGEAARVVEQNVSHPVDAAQEIEIDTIDGINRLEPLAVGMPHESIGGVNVVDWRRRRRQAIKRVGDTAQ